MKVDGVHCGEGGLAFGGGWDEGEETYCVACGEDEEDYGGDAIEVGGFHFLILLVDWLKTCFLVLGMASNYF